MYIPIILTIVICILLIYMAWDRYETRKEREKLTRLFIAKNAKEVTEMEILDKINIKPNIPIETPPADIPIENMTEEEFDHICDTFRDPRVWKIENGQWVKENIYGESSPYGNIHI